MDKKGKDRKTGTKQGILSLLIIDGGRSIPARVTQFPFSLLD